jgi:polyphosphate kinase
VKNLYSGAAMVRKKQVDQSQQFDIDSSEWYLNRELTWLAFNKRVLAEAGDKRVPLLERVFYVAVVGSNLDEFFMKRIGGLKQQVGAGVRKKTVDGMLPQEQIDASYVIAQEMLEEQRVILADLRELLAGEGITFCSYDELSAAQKKEMDLYFNKEIYPLLTPQGIDPAHPFPFISNLSLNLLVATSESPNGTVFLNRVKIPHGVGVPRFLKVGKQHLYLTFEELVANNLSELFPGLHIHSCEYFRVTRNAVTDRMEEQANDLLVMIESALRDRKFADIVRLQISRNFTPHHRGMLAAELVSMRKKTFSRLRAFSANRT